MKINYNLTGPERKKLVQTIAEILECDAKYLGAPSFSYQIDYFTIDKNGTLIFDDRADSSEIEELIEALCERGFEAEIETEESVLAIAYPRSKMSDAGIERLKKLLDAKGDLIKKALGVDALPIEIDDEKNAIRGEEIAISTADSRTPVLVIPTNEELAIARETLELVK